MQGSSRFQRMLKAAESGAIIPPADIRYLKTGVSRQPSANDVTGRILTFLQTVYESVGETLPDMRSEADCELSLVPGFDADVDPDPYSEALQQKTIKPSRKKPRTFKSLNFDPAMTVEQEDRWLPPGGHMRDYWEQMCLHDSPVSFAQFWRVHLVQN